MARDQLFPWKGPFLSLRMIEWALVAGLILALWLVFAWHMRVLQGQGELSAVKTTLSALRTAFINDYLRKSAAAEDASVASAQHNPFELVQRHPANYLGEMSPEQAAASATGGWVFDPVCVCVGYLPINSEWFDSPSGDLMAWYRVTGESGSLQLTAKENYLWQGEVMK